MAIKCPKCQTDNPDTQKFCGECGTGLFPAKEIHVTKTLEIPKEELTRGTALANRYEIIEELGKGGMGKVYRALDKKLKEEVALKLIKPEISSDEKMLERFHNELKLARKIRHSHVGGMYELLEDRGMHYITMEYVRGEDLKSLIRRVKKIPATTVISIAKQICEGLSEAHRLGVIHRDLKPSNIMIDKEGNARIMDFGIARLVKEKGITGEGIVIGTPEYMSPEQAEGEDVDQRSDIYSLGVILYEMVTGRVPFEGDTALGIAMKHKSEKPIDPKTVNADIPFELSRLILTCLEKEKDNRYKSAEELLSVLKKIEEPKRGKIITPRWRNSIAVLPFTNMSGDPEQEYFCDGITEELINSLTQLKDLRVIARTSSFMFKDKHEDIREIGRKLNVETLLEGSVRKSGNRLRITAQLVDVSDGSHLWSDRFDREIEDVFAIQDEISLAIVDRLKVKLLGEEKDSLLKRSTDNLDAYNLYLKGRYFCWNRRTKEGLNKGLEFFQKATEIDPLYALAYSGIADAYSLHGFLGWLPPKEVHTKSKAAAVKALEIDDTLGEAHTAMAWIKDWYEWDWIGAKREIEQAITLNPSGADAYHKYSHFLAEMGYFDESIEAMNRALELEPLAIELHGCSGMNLYLARRYDEAIEQLKKTIELDPNFYDPYGWLGMTYVQKEKYKEAIEIFQSAESFSEISTRMIATQVYAYGVSGHRDEAQKRLRRVIEISKKERVEPYFIAWAYTGLMEKNRAMDFLDKACEARSGFMRMLIKVDPWFDNLRLDPRFVAILKKIGMEK